MQLIKVSKSTTLSDISKLVGERNVSTLLATNNLSRTVNVGKAFGELCANIVNNSIENINWQRKVTLLNKFSQDSDIFEEAALAGDNTWKVLSSIGTFPNRMKVPESMKLPDSTDILGNGIPVKKAIYQQAMTGLQSDNHSVNPVIFNPYLSKPKGINAIQYSSTTYTNVFQDFNIPWGDVTVYDSITGESMDIPGYPEEIPDTRGATYSSMPDIIYQYEPWVVYQNSGPRSNTYTWNLHRQMWNGDERDGKANELIRFCQSCVYPEYNGSAVITPYFTLYIHGVPLISGVLTSVATNYSGPIGLDYMPLAFSLALTISEVSQKALNHTTVRQIPTIG